MLEERRPQAGKILPNGVGSRPIRVEVINNLPWGKLEGRPEEKASERLCLAQKVTYILPTRFTYPYSG